MYNTGPLTTNTFVIHVQIFDTHVEHTGNMQVNMYRVGIHAGKYGRADNNWVFNLIVRRGMPTAGGVVKATDVFQRLKES